MKKILIVDDHPAVIRVLRLGIEQAGYVVDSARDGLECMEKLAEAHPDFVVTDIDMPRMSGRELCEAIEATYPDRGFPIVVLTSRSELEHRDWTGAIENLSFMEKPVSMRQLLSHIDHCLNDYADSGVA
ncbi:MAG: response regulator [Woeseia sp.]|nr:response regulator [Woeseia sp.]NNE60748.1 response regulator [Woeseia sp.]